MFTKSCETIAGVGPALATKLAKCGIKTIADLLLHLPLRYQDKTHITPMVDLRVNDYALITGRIIKTEIRPGRRLMLTCTVQDKTGLIVLSFFHFNRQQVKTLQASSWIRAFGEIRAFANQMTMIHPEYRLLEAEHEQVVEETLTPIYPSTEGLTQNRLRQLIQKTLDSYQTELKKLEWMSEQELAEHLFPPFDQALTLLHHPPADTPLGALETSQHPALLRVAFEELLAQHISMQYRRAHRSQCMAPKLMGKTLPKQFLEQLPFTLTKAQQRVSREIAEDLAQSKPMLRLVQGDVGCGKTVIAALAALQAIEAGYQVALMAPTDLLSEQHATHFKQWLSPLGITCLRLSGKIKAREKREIKEALSKNTCQILIGTHALFQESVTFASLGLIIIDEQHRFGVEQRLLLQQKGLKNHTAHQLLMTATPIPRTLAMAQMAHMDISIIDELPAGRIPIQTAVLNQDKREAIVERLQITIAEGAQIYWIGTLIEESLKLQCAAVTITAATLQEQLPKVRIGLVHGQLSAAEKEQTMLAFKKGDLDLLVATTVIEVGVDVPNASVMVIENAERLGLSQLHQLRGRVGRGNQRSFCLLLYKPPLSATGLERLRIVRDTTDGFVIAEKDLVLRGAGEILGTRQTGYRQFKVANLARDGALIPRAAKMAKRLLKEAPATAHRIAYHWLGDFEQFLQG